MSIDWSKQYKKYKGMWVAFQQDEKTVIASGKTAAEAWGKAKEKGFRKPILNRMPDKLVTCV